MAAKWDSIEWEMEGQRARLGRLKLYCGLKEDGKWLWYTEPFGELGGPSLSGEAPSREAAKAAAEDAARLMALEILRALGDTTPEECPEARERLSSLSSVLGFGFGDDSTSLLELVSRVEEGTKFHTDVAIATQNRLIAERDAALARVRELEAARWKPVHISIFENEVSAWATEEARARWGKGLFADPLPFDENGNQPGYDR